MLSKSVIGWEINNENCCDVVKNLPSEMCVLLSRKRYETFSHFLVTLICFVIRLYNMWQFCQCNMAGTNLCIRNYIKCIFLSVYVNFRIRKFKSSATRVFCFISKSGCTFLLSFELQTNCTNFHLYN